MPDTEGARFVVRAVGGIVLMYQDVVFVGAFVFPDSGTDWLTHITAGIVTSPVGGLTTVIMTPTESMQVPVNEAVYCPGVDAENNPVAGLINAPPVALQEP